MNIRTRADVEEGESYRFSMDKKSVIAHLRVGDKVRFGELTNQRGPEGEVMTVSEDHLEEVTVVDSDGEEHRFTGIRHGPKIIGPQSWLYQDGISEGRVKEFEVVSLSGETVKVEDVIETEKVGEEEYSKDDVETILEDGTKVVFDGRIFHKAGMDGVHHIEEDVEAFIEPSSSDPEVRRSGRRTLLLTEETRKKMDTSHLLDGIKVNPKNIGEHPKIAEVHRVGEEEPEMNWEATPTTE